MLVEVAGAVFGIEDGAGFVVGELFEQDCSFVIFVENTGGEIAGEPGVEPGERRNHPGADAGSAGRIGLRQKFKTSTEACCILLRDGEYSNAALRTSGPADEVMAAASGSICQCGGDDLDEVGHG